MRLNKISLAPKGDFPRKDARIDFLQKKLPTCDQFGVTHEEHAEIIKWKRFE